MQPYGDNQLSHKDDWQGASRHRMEEQPVRSIVELGSDSNAADAARTLL
jgi:hypothetical protein